MTNRICHIRLVNKVAAPRWTFEGGICDAARESLVVLRHDEDDQMQHSEYHYFPNWARKGVDVVGVAC
jgi:hypothetical protein